MARAVSTRRKVATTALAWAIGLLIFFPIYWTILTSFKTEAQAINNPPLFWSFDFTLENYSVVQERSNYMRFLWNSVIIAGGSTTLSWGAVTNADSAEIEGIGGVATPGSIAVNPVVTTTYRLIARCGSNVASAQVVVGVAPLVLPPSIRVVIYDFINRAGSAAGEWRSSGGLGSFTLPFPGSDTDNRGFALIRNNAVLNDGSIAPTVLEMHPQWTADGSISRCFTDMGYGVQADDEIRGKVGFLQGATAGQVTFQVSAVRAMGVPMSAIVANIPLAYGDGVKSFSVRMGDLSGGMLVGMPMYFCISVLAGPSSGQDWAVWRELVLVR